MTVSAEQKRANWAAYMRAYNAKNPEGNRAKCRAYYAKNRAARLEYQRAYALRNSDWMREYLAAYSKSPTGKAIRRAAEHKRRAVTRGETATASAADVKHLLLTATKCFYCEQEFTDALRPTLDHKMAIARGGTHAMDNLTAACGPCNFRKGARSDTEFVAILSRAA